MTLEISEKEKRGHALGLVDNSMFRFDVEVLKNHCETVKADKVIIHGGVEKYRFIKQYLKVLKNSVVSGFPKGLIEGLPVEGGVIPPEDVDELPYPNWAFLPLDNYFRNSPRPHNAETALLTRRGFYKSRWGNIVQDPGVVAETLKYLKLVYNYDFIEFDEDLSVNWRRTFKMLDALEELDMAGLFKWSCRVDPLKVNVDCLASARNSGCSFIDFGEFDVTGVRDLKYLARLEMAIHAARKAEVTPLVTCTIGYPGTRISDVVEAVTFLRSNGMQCKPEILKPYPGTGLYKKVEDTVDDLDKHLLQVNESFMNYTGWSDAELLGIVELMAKNDVKRLDVFE